MAESSNISPVTTANGNIGAGDSNPGANPPKTDQTNVNSNTDTDSHSTLAQPNQTPETPLASERKKYLGILGPEDPQFDKIEQAWDVISACIREILNTFDTTRRNWSCIALFRLGYERDERENPKTVYVSVFNDTSEEEFPAVVGKMQENLGSEFGELGLVAHLERDGPCYLDQW